MDASQVLAMLSSPSLLREKPTVMNSIAPSENGSIDTWTGT
jgi:hypothetical protein